MTVAGLTRAERLRVDKAIFVRPFEHDAIERAVELFSGDSRDEARSVVAVLSGIAARRHCVEREEREASHEDCPHCDGGV